MSIREHTCLRGAAPRWTQSSGIREHTRAYVSIREHTCLRGAAPKWTQSSGAQPPHSSSSPARHSAAALPAYASIRQHTVSIRSAYVSRRQHACTYQRGRPANIRQHTSADVSIRYGYVSVGLDTSEHTPAYVSSRQHTVRIRQQTSAYV